MVQVLLPAVELLLQRTYEADAQAPLRQLCCQVQACWAAANNRYIDCGARFKRLQLRGQARLLRIALGCLTSIVGGVQAG